MNYPPCDWCGEGPNCPRHDLDRFEIREIPAGPRALEVGITWPVFKVWDRHLNKSVPFGNYRDRARAEARVDRENRKAAEPDE